MRGTCNPSNFRGALRNLRCNLTPVKRDSDRTRGTSDADAVAAYKPNMASVAAAKLPLDLVVIANWTAHPANDLPESDPNSLTGVFIS